MEYSNLQDKLDQFQHLHQTTPNKKLLLFSFSYDVWIYRIIPCRQEEHVAIIQQTWVVRVNKYKERES